MIDALIYLLLAILSTILIFSGVKKKVTLAVGVGLALPILYSGLRIHTGTDFAVYVLMYNEVVTVPFLHFITAYTVEPTFYLLSIVSRSIFGSPFLVFFTFSLLTVVFFYKGLMRYAVELNHKAFAWLSYLLIIFPNTLNISRQGLAISIAFYAFTFIPERKLGKYLFWMVVAILFHYSTVVLLPAYLFNKVISPKSTTSYNQLRTLVLSISLALVLPIALVLGVRILALPEKYTNYIAAGAEGNNLLFFIIAGVMMLLMVLFSIYQKQKEGSATLYPYLYSMVAVSLLFAGFFVGESRRFALYFLPYLGLFIPIVIGMIPTSTTQRFIQTLAILYIVGYFFMFYVGLGYGDVFPYQSVLSGGSYD